jgi:hypothetical protein
MQAAGELLLLDARGTLATFMADGMPDAAAFTTIVPAIIERSAATGATARFAPMAKWWTSCRKTPDGGRDSPRSTLESAGDDACLLAAVWRRRRQFLQGRWHARDPCAAFSRDSVGLETAAFRFAHPLIGRITLRHAAAAALKSRRFAGLKQLHDALWLGICSDRSYRRPSHSSRRPPN